jgi:hypothetical protein
MGNQMKTPGASGNATEGEIETWKFLSLGYRSRKEWAILAFCFPALDGMRGRALGLIIRKGLFAKLLETFGKPNPLGFLARVDAEGKFLNLAAL